MARDAVRATEDDAAAAAEAAGLRHVTDAGPGIRRRRRGRGFQYVSPAGATLRDEAVLERIRSLAVPPAWTDVWICPSPVGHLQATGRDARGRKQYRYHPRWREVRDATKYHRMIAFGKALPRIRRRVDRDLARRRGLERERVLAAVVRLLDTTNIRIGNDEYARDNRSFGLTTLRDRHAKVSGPRVTFRFRGKGGRAHEVEVEDARVARIVRRCRDLPGQHLFQYVGEDGEVADVGSDDVNAYLAAIAGDDFTAKDFRTWAGTVLAAWALQEAGGGSPTAAKRELTAAVEEVARDLGNTPAVCRRCYVHPAVVGAHLDGSLRKTFEREAAGRRPRGTSGLSRHEATVLRLLRRRLRAERAGG